MSKKGRVRFGRDGFTAVEVLLALGVAIPLVLGAACLAVAAVRASHDEKVTAQFTLPGSPTVLTKVVSRRATPDVELDAITFHAVFTQALRHSIACYVFGAAPNGAVPSTPDGTSFLHVGPLQRSSWIDLAISPLKERSSRELLNDYPLIGGTNPYAGTGSFSVVIVGPRSGGVGITALAQVVTTPATVSAPATAATDALVLVWARLWTADGTWEYAWLAPQANAANATWSAKANQFWTWVDEARNVFEPGPAVCTFPDPVGASDSGPGISRFTYHL